ncbi:hypothetical protein DESAMIL20_1189 [Desulfurella amilsii]|uniref:Uncharacterized protein n=1 Tax=Desulfurella amilsii TaxID=1562698 RepID=A0A1X4XVR3_9BACT|nr:hypothetical protein DESAMIL20_1189 [Desulfurella amilsii]
MITLYEIPDHEVMEKLERDIEEGIKNETILFWLKDFEEY